MNLGLKPLKIDPKIAFIFIYTLYLVRLITLEWLITRTPAGLAGRSRTICTCPNKQKLSRPQVQKKLQNFQFEQNGTKVKK